MGHIFAAISPFAKNFLAVAKDAQQMFLINSAARLTAIDTNIESIWIVMRWTFTLDYSELVLQ